ncbi:Protein CBR-LRX-1 [Aphelenchoides bicaudatus]|nr:Protein CBR-LRX-1 [Aphelenchoides bicaudatus]
MAPLPIAPQISANANNFTNVPLAPSIVDSNATDVLPQQVLSLQLPMQPPPKLTHEINYCDRRQFDDEQLAALHLKRSDYFIYNTSCAGVFFQCAIGQTFVLKCPSVDGQAFDPAISSCNFRNSIRFCPEYDHVLHCTIRETCTSNEFACCALPQQCIEYSRRCDGHRDCADGEDETNCPSCARDQFACVKSGTCIPAKLRCDGHPDDCADGSNLDEIGCSKNETCLGKFVCDSPETLSIMKHSVCIDVEKYCDNQRDCPNGEDEINCRQNDEPATKYLSCENQKQQVRKEQWCDGREDCADASDEKYCF